MYSLSLCVTHRGCGLLSVLCRSGMRRESGRPENGRWVLVGVERDTSTVDGTKTNKRIEHTHIDTHRANLQRILCQCQLCLQRTWTSLVKSVGHRKRQTGAADTNGLCEYKQSNCTCLIIGYSFCLQDVLTWSYQAASSPSDSPVYSCLPSAAAVCKMYTDS